MSRNLVVHCHHNAYRKERRGSKGRKETPGLFVGGAPRRPTHKRHNLPLSHLSLRQTGGNSLILILVLLTGLILGGCAPVQLGATPTGANEQQVRTPISLGVGYIPSVQFAPYYVGIEQGFFAENGIDLSLEYGFENDYLTLVGSGNRQFMVGSGDQVILGRAQQMPVTYVYRWFSQFPVVAFAPTEAGINAPADLAGKKIGIPGAFGASWIALLALLDAGGLTTEDVQIESIGFTQAAAISEGLVDVAIDYAVNGPIVLAQEGIATTQIAVDDYLVMPANGIVTNETTIADHPDLVRNLNRALAESVAWTLANPNEAFAIALKHVPEAGGDNETANRAVFDASLPIWAVAEDARAGATSLEEWSQAATFLYDRGIITTQVDPATLFTNDFLPE